MALAASKLKGEERENEVKVRDLVSKQMNRDQISEDQWFLGSEQRSINNRSLSFLLFMNEKPYCAPRGGPTPAPVGIGWIIFLVPVLVPMGGYESS